MIGFKKVNQVKSKFGLNWLIFLFLKLTIIPLFATLFLLTAFVGLLGANTVVKSPPFNAYQMYDIINVLYANILIYYELKSFGNSGLLKDVGFKYFKIIWLWMGAFGGISLAILFVYILPAQSAAAGRISLMYIFLSIFVTPWQEEIVLRGFTLSVLKKYFRPWIVSFLLTIIVAIIHSGLEIRGVVCAIIFSLILLHIRNKTDSLGPCIITHISYNTGIVLLNSYGLN